MVEKAFGSEFISESIRLCKRVDEVASETELSEGDRMALYTAASRLAWVTGIVSGQEERIRELEAKLEALSPKKDAP